MEIHNPYYQKQIFVCINKRELPEESCGMKDSENIHKRLKDYVKENGLRNKVRVSKSYCQDLCSFGPIVSIYPDNVVYRKVTLDDVNKIIEMHIK